MSIQFLSVMAALAVIILFAGYLIHSKSSDRHGKHS